MRNSLDGYFIVLNSLTYALRPCVNIYSIITISNVFSYACLCACYFICMQCFLQLKMKLRTNLLILVNYL